MIPGIWNVLVRGSETGTGVGYAIHLKSWRPSTVEEILTIEIKPGWKKGTKITFPEKGNEQRGVIPSDLVFIIDEKPHGAFKRDGNDLIVTQKISLVEALTGFTAQLTTLDGRNLTVPINAIISPTYEEVVKGEGMPIPKEPSKKGNLRIKFNIKFPTRLTSEQKNWHQEIVGILMNITGGDFYQTRVRLLLFSLMALFWKRKFMSCRMGNYIKQSFR
ncbi:DNAJ heat shock family protein [Actinidia rufa]|uniref:DNAJ heat shock family protein n=1 Tax=Actinidia rufa TaxID=165716 RepID=A0A7J0F5E9_9ERIC|nr:DNAJ heat shock family protein [Actinidia rufa]